YGSILGNRRDNRFENHEPPRHGKGRDEGRTIGQSAHQLYGRRHEHGFTFTTCSPRQLVQRAAVTCGVRPVNAVSQTWQIVETDVRSAQKTRQHRIAALARRRFRMELHADDGMRAMFDGHDLAVVTGCSGYTQFAWHRSTRNDERMITSDAEGRREALENTRPVVRNEGRSAVHGTS